MTKQKITILVGPTCGGKTTLQNHMVKHNGYTKIITETDRPTRVGEVNGVDYNFHNQQYLSLVDPNDVLLPRTWQVINGDIYRYWISKTSLENFIKTNKYGVIVLDPRGARKLIDILSNEYRIQPFVVEVTAPIYQLVNRAGKRGDSFDELNRRIDDDEIYLSQFRKEGLVDLTVGSIEEEVEPNKNRASVSSYLI